MKLIHKLAFAAGLLAMVLVLGACGPVAPATIVNKIPEITIHAVDFSYNAPTQIQSGLVTVTMINDGHEDHQAQLARLNDGVTMDQLMAALQKSPEDALPLVALAGGPNVIAPGQKQTVTVNLSAGNYVLLCFVSGSDNVPHLAKGMVAPLTVAATPGNASGAPAAVAEPQSTGSVSLQDFAIAVPDKVQAGSQVWKVTNNGPEPHEFGLVRMEDGKTAQDFQAFMQNPNGQPPFSSVGGLGALAPNTSGWVNLDLKPGTYVALCFVPDPKTGKSHAELGMVTSFTVQ
jgi:uncharacterized cupredoxin-like copper-binding protein